MRTVQWRKESEYSSGKVGEGAFSVQSRRGFSHSIPKYSDGRRELTLITPSACQGIDR